MREPKTKPLLTGIINGTITDANIATNQLIEILAERGRPIVRDDVETEDYEKEV